MLTYPERIALIVATSGASRASAHALLVTTAEGQQSYREHLQAQGVGGAGLQMAVAPAAGPRPKYLQLVADARARDGTLTATDAHKMVMRSHRSAYAEHLAAKGITQPGVT